MHPDRGRACLKVLICFKHPEFLIGRRGVVIIYLAFGLSFPYPHPHRCLSNIGNYSFQSQSLQTHKPHRWHTKIYSKHVRLKEISVLLDSCWKKTAYKRGSLSFFLWHICTLLHRHAIVSCWSVGVSINSFASKFNQWLKNRLQYVCGWQDHMIKTKYSCLTLENGSKLMKLTWNNEGTASKKDEESVSRQEYNTEKQLSLSCL